MTAAQERDAFSRRLRASLDRAGWRTLGATALAREFNRRSTGQPVTAHATRKWLQGEAIPAQDNLQALARWLEVPAQWLRFGEPQPLAPVDAAPPPTASEAPPLPYGPERVARLAADFARLSAEQQRVIEELIGVLLKKHATPEGS
ncbi:hypothetical protein [Xenophilus sp.]|uniref:hypothetical protein n=1 Tax=Xenophilus sp. TaxID=1873499 RepID=UPI0037DC7759